MPIRRELMSPRGRAFSRPGLCWHSRVELLPRTDEAAFAATRFDHNFQVDELAQGGSLAE